MNHGIHLALQAKGGIGKSLTCRLLGEYLEAECIDADPSNRTLSRCEGLNCRQFDLLDDERRIDAHRIDQLMESVIADPGDVVIDVGASSFVEVDAYWRENDLETLILDQNKRLYYHLIVVGGSMQGECLASLAQRMDGIDSRAHICVWENRYFGPLTLEEGRSLQDIGIGETDGSSHIVLVQRSKLHVRELEVLNSEGKLFSEAIAASHELIRTSRLKQIRHSVWTQLDAVFLNDEEEEHADAKAADQSREAS